MGCGTIETVTDTIGLTDHAGAAAARDPSGDGAALSGEDGADLPPPPSELLGARSVERPVRRIPGQAGSRQRRRRASRQRSERE